MNDSLKQKINKYKSLLKLFILKNITNTFNYNIEKNIRSELIKFGYEYCNTIINNQ